MKTIEACLTIPSLAEATKRVLSSKVSNKHIKIPLLTAVHRVKTRYFYVLINAGNDVGRGGWAQLAV